MSTWHVRHDHDERIEVGDPKDPEHMGIIHHELQITTAFTQPPRRPDQSPQSGGVHETDPAQINDDDARVGLDESKFSLQVIRARCIKLTPQRDNGGGRLTAH
jgi:hypothetical protein